VTHVTLAGLNTANYTLQYGYRKLWELVRISWMAALKLLLLTLPLGVHYTVLCHVIMNGSSSSCEWRQGGQL